MAHVFNSVDEILNQALTNLGFQIDEFKHRSNLRLLRFERAIDAGNSGSPVLVYAAQTSDSREMLVKVTKYGEGYVGHMINPRPGGATCIVKR
jgi:hypothetical protein